MLPFCPIIIDYLLETLVVGYDFPRQTILVIGFVLPVIQILETHHGLVILLYTIIAFCNVALYMILNLSLNDLLDADSKSAYLMGLGLTVLVVISSIGLRTFKLVQTLRAYRQTL